MYLVTKIAAATNFKHHFKMKLLVNNWQKGAARVL